MITITKEKLERMNKQGIRVYKFKAFIHPLRGGDDYLLESAITAKSEDRARDLIKAMLILKSAVVDFIITGELTPEECK